MKKIIGNVFKVIAVVFVMVLIVKVSTPASVLAFADTEKLVVTFRDSYEVKQGYVEYSLNDGASWVKVTSNIQQNVTMAGDHLKIRIVSEDGYSIDWSGISYTEDEEGYSLRDNANGSIVGALMGSNGYQASENASLVKLENVEFRSSEHLDTPVESSFDGKAYLIWQCSDGSTCLHYFDDILENTDGSYPTTYYKVSEVKDERTGEKFNLNAKVKDFADYRAVNKWIEEYKRVYEVTSVPWADINPSSILYGSNTKNEILDRGTSLDPCNSPDGNNSYTHFGDRNFKVTIYNDDYVGVTLGSVSDFTYFPNFWNKLEFSDAIDISGTSEDNPAVLETVLLESTVTIKSKGINGVEFSSIEALNVPSNAITVTKNGNKFQIKFHSNFYDRVLFKIVDASGKAYYLGIVRLTVSIHDNFGPNVTDQKLFAQVYYSNSQSYRDFEVIATLVYKNGSTKQVKATHQSGYEDSLGNWVDEDESIGSEEGLLKVATWAVDVNDNVIGVYFNVKKAGSTDSTYAGTFTGSGRGMYYDLDRESDTFRSIDYGK